MGGSAVDPGKTCRSIAAGPAVPYERGREYSPGPAQGLRRDVKGKEGMVNIRHVRQKAKLTAPGVCDSLSDPQELPALRDRKQSTCMSREGAEGLVDGYFGVSGPCRGYGQTDPPFPRGGEGA